MKTFEQSKSGPV